MLRYYTILLFFSVLAVYLLFPERVEAQRTIRLPQNRNTFDGLKLQHGSPLHRPKVGLVLSGGGARGLAQIGVLKTLERYHIPVDFIAANSMGSVIGGLYAAGFTTVELESIASHTNWEEILSFSEGTERRELFLGQKKTNQVGYLTIRFDGLQAIIPSSFSSGQGLTDYFMNLTLKALYHPDTSFDNLKIPYRAVAVDLISGKRVVLDKGSLAEAMRSSITVPLLYTPLERDSMALIDGGLISNIPVDLAFDAGCDIVIAVNSTSGLRTAENMQAPWEVADQIMTIVMQKPNSEQLSRADVVITPDVGDRLVSDFTDVHSIIAAGERATNEKIPELKELLTSTPVNEYPTIDSTFTNVIVNIEGKFIPEQEKLYLQHLPLDGNLTLHEIEHQLTRLTTSQLYADCHVVISDSGERCIVTFVLTLQPIVEQITFSGNSVIESSEIHTITRDYEGNALNYDSTQHMLERVLYLYREDGYALARITNVDIDPATAIIRFTINEGIIHDVLCQGNFRTKDYVIRREFPWEYGDVFNLAKANVGLANIYSSGLYEYLLMDVRYKNEQPVVIMKVKERSAELMRLGIHADNEHGLVGTVDFRDANFRGAGEDISLLLRYGIKDRVARIDYRANRIFRTYLTFDFKGYVYSRDVLTYRDDPGNTIEHWERIEEGKYRETRIGGSFTFGSQLDRLGDVTAEIRTERQRISGISGTGYNDEDYRFASLKIQTTLDTENKFVFPTEGMYLSLGYETALKGLGSEVSFTKISASWSMYHTFFNKHTIHPHFTLGFGDKTLPLAEQYSIGGQHSFFGLQEDDSRGRQLFLGSLEYRLGLPFRILYDTYLSARYDLGTISTLPEELKFSKFRHGVGILIGLDTPIGAASFAIGKSFYFRRELKEAPLSTGPLVFYFSIGPNL